MAGDYILNGIIMWLLIYKLLKTNAFDDIQEFGIKTDTDWSFTYATAVITLWYNFTIYQFSVTPNSANKWYLSYDQQQPPFDMLGLQCYNRPNASEAKLMIELNFHDPIGLDQVTFITKSGVWYTIDQFVTIENVLKGCLCIGTERDDCLWSDCRSNGIHKQIIYFDLLQPNQVIYDAIVIDGSNIFPQEEVCQTMDVTNTPIITSSSAPTYIPSYSSTNVPLYTTTIASSPTHNSTDDTAANPSLVAYTKPTISPSNKVTLYSEKTTNTKYTNGATKTSNIPPEQSFMNGYIGWIVAAFCSILFITAAILGCVIKHYLRKRKQLIRDERTLSEVTQTAPGMMTVPTIEGVQLSQTETVHVTDTITPGIQSTDEGGKHPVINIKAVMKGSAIATKGGHN